MPIAGRFYRSTTILRSIERVILSSCDIHDPARHVAGSITLRMVDPSARPSLSGDEPVEARFEVTKGEAFETDDTWTVESGYFQVPTGRDRKDRFEAQGYPVLAQSSRVLVFTRPDTDRLPVLNP